MVALFTEGFDKYGPLTSATSGPGYTGTALTAGEWTSVGSGTAMSIVSPLSSTGFALSVTINTAISLSKTLAASYSRLIGGIRFNLSTAGSQPFTIQFQDSGTAQCSLTLPGGTGLWSLRTGTAAGTILATATTSVSVGSTHYLEWDITFAASGAYSVWLDGTLLFSGTGATRTTTNNSANIFAIGGAAAGPTVILDDLYIFDSTGTTCNAVLNNNPRIETVFPVSDAQAQFSVGATTLGATTTRAPTTGTYNGSANDFVVKNYTPARNCTLNSVTLRIGTASNSTANLRAILYADNAGVPGTLIASGTTVTGVSPNTTLTLPFASGQSLTAGTQYWVGFMVDVALTSFLLSETPTYTIGRRATSTFSSGAPATAPTTTATSTTPCVWGNIANTVPANYVENAVQPPIYTTENWSYVDSQTVGNEDLFAMSALSAPSANIYVAATKVYMSLSSSGVRTGSVHTSSSGTDSGAPSVTPPTTYSWESQYLMTDPNTGLPWTVSAANAALAGYRLDS